jgi:cytochrome b6-f complex iron-sulfur subunit
VDAQPRRRFLATGASAVAAFVVAGCTSHKKATPPEPTIPFGGRTARPIDTGSFGDVIDVGALDDILHRIEADNAPHYVPEARAYVTRFPADDIEAAKSRYPAAMHAGLDAGVIVLYQRCTHLGCRTPWCSTSRWYECPCHGAKFDQVGEMRAGPAPRGMDLMPVSVRDGHLLIDTRSIVKGMPIDTDTTHQDPAGPFCVSP